MLGFGLERRQKSYRQDRKEESVLRSESLHTIIVLGHGGPVTGFPGQSLSPIYFF